MNMRLSVGFTFVVTTICLVGWTAANAGALREGAPLEPTLVAQLTPAEEEELAREKAEARARAAAEEAVREAQAEAIEKARKRKERFGDLSLYELSLELRRAHEEGRTDDAEVLARRISEMRQRGVRVGIFDVSSDWWDDDHPVLVWSLITVAALVALGVALAAIALALGFFVRLFRWAARI